MHHASAHRCYNHAPPKHPAGFSLVELGVVLVIIGLLLGSVLAGKTLIEQAEIRRVISELQEIRGGSYTFELQYDAQPGDLDNATSYWPPTNSDGSSTGYNTEDGDNDGEVEQTNEAGINESIVAWQHMAYAQILEGRFSGVLGVNGQPYIPGVNVPESRRKGALYRFFYVTTYNQEGNAIEISSLLPDNSDAGGAALSPQESAVIDEKLDDGIANAGFMMALDAVELNPDPQNPTPTCLVNAVALDFAYNAADTSKRCRLRFY